MLVAALAGAGQALAVEAVAVRPGTPAVDLLPAAERYQVTVWDYTQSDDRGTLQR